MPPISHLRAIHRHLTEPGPGSQVEDNFLSILHEELLMEDFRQEYVYRDGFPRLEMLSQLRNQMVGFLVACKLREAYEARCRATCMSSWSRWPSSKLSRSACHFRRLSSSESDLWAAADHVPSQVAGSDWHAKSTSQDHKTPPTDSM